MGNSYVGGDNGGPPIALNILTSLVANKVVKLFIVKGTVTVTSNGP